MKIDKSSDPALFKPVVFTTTLETPWEVEAFRAVIGPSTDASMDRALMNTAAKAGVGGTAEQAKVVREFLHALYDFVAD